MCCGLMQPDHQAISAANSRGLMEAINPDNCAPAAHGISAANSRGLMEARAGNTGREGRMGRDFRGE